jgi:hypothetical protein
MIRTVVLWIHIVSGALGMLVGLAAIWSTWRRRTHTASGEVYHWLVLLICVSAAGLAVLSWSSLWWFIPIAAASYAFAFVAYRAARRRRPGWLATYLRGLGGSYIALTTAILVVSVPDLPAVWFLPTVLGVPIVEWASHRSGVAGSGVGAAESR